MGRNTTTFRMTTDSGFSLETNEIDSIQFGKSANFNLQEIINRSSPKVTYKDSGAITISVSLDLLAQDSTNWSAEDVNLLTKALLSLTFPRQSGTRAPSICRITYGAGTLFSNFDCVLTNVQGGLGAPYADEGDPMFGKINLSFTGLELQAKDAEEFAENAISSFKLSRSRT